MTAKRSIHLARIAWPLLRLTRLCRRIERNQLCPLKALMRITTLPAVKDKVPCDKPIGFFSSLAHKRSSFYLMLASQPPLKATQHHAIACLTN